MPISYVCVTSQYRFSPRRHARRPRTLHKAITWLIFLIWDDKSYYHTIKRVFRALGNISRVFRHCRTWYRAFMFRWLRCFLIQFWCNVRMVACNIRALRHPGAWFNIKMSSYQYRKSHCGDKTILRPSYLHNGLSYTGKTTSLCWIGALMWWQGARPFCVDTKIGRTDRLSLFVYAKLRETSL